LSATLLLNSIAKKVALRKSKSHNLFKINTNFAANWRAAVRKTATFGLNSAIVAISENEISGQRQRPGSSVASAAP
jgi:hypothetical protein